MVHKIVLLLFTFISLNVFSQGFSIKSSSFVSSSDSSFIKINTDTTGYIGSQITSKLVQGQQGMNSSLSTIISLYQTPIPTTENIQINGSESGSITNITTTTTLNATHHKVLVSNGATNITITLPDALTCLGREYVISRAAGSTGSITVQGTGTNTIQAVSGTTGATTSIALHSLTGGGLNIRFTAINIAGVGYWIRI